MSVRTDTVVIQEPRTVETEVTVCDGCAFEVAHPVVDSYGQQRVVPGWTRIIPKISADRTSPLADHLDICPACFEDLSQWLGGRARGWMGLGQGVAR